MLSKVRRVQLLVGAGLIAAFAIFFPYLDAAGSCGDSGCSQISQAHGAASAGLASGAMLGLLAVIPAAPVFAALTGRRPVQIYLSPEPDPPRL